MITYDMIEAGYSAGLIKLVNAEKYYGDGIACAIGDNWFYFGGHTAEEYDDPEIFKNDIPEPDIVRSIYDALIDLSVEFEDECLYYESFLRENLGLETDTISDMVAKALEVGGRENVRNVRDNDLSR